METGVLRVRGWLPPRSEGTSLSLALALMPSQSSVFLKKSINQTSLWRNSENSWFFLLLHFAFYSLILALTLNNFPSHLQGKAMLEEVILCLCWFPLQIPGSLPPGAPLPTSAGHWEVLWPLPPPPSSPLSPPAAASPGAGWQGPECARH